MPTLHASTEGLLIFAVIGLISALSNWIKKRHEEAERAKHLPAPHPGADQPVPAPQKAPARPGWQEELRRLLEGDLSGHETPPPGPLHEPAPPVVHRTTIPRVPAPEPVAEPRWAGRDKELVPPLVLPTGTHFPSWTEPTPATEAPSGPAFELEHMEASTAAYERGQHAPEAAIVRLHEAVAQTVAARPSLPSLRLEPRFAQARELAARLHNPATARQAILAAVILGPPRALEKGAGALAPPHQLSF
jgi:hypothetical protein